MTSTIDTETGATDPTEGMTPSEKAAYRIRQRIKAKAAGKKAPAGSPTRVPGPSRTN